MRVRRRGSSGAQVPHNAPSNDRSWRTSRSARSSPVGSIRAPSWRSPAAPPRQSRSSASRSASQDAEARGEGMAAICPTPTVANHLGVDLHTIYGRAEMVQELERDDLLS